MVRCSRHILVMAKLDMCVLLVLYSSAVECVFFFTVRATPEMCTSLIVDSVRCVYVTGHTHLVAHASHGTRISWHTHLMAHASHGTRISWHSPSYTSPNPRDLGETHMPASASKKKILCRLLLENNNHYAMITMPDVRRYT